MPVPVWNGLHLNHSIIILYKRIKKTFNPIVPRIKAPDTAFLKMRRDLQRHEGFMPYLKAEPRSSHSPMH